MNNNQTRYFQWVLGDRKDQICLFDHIETDEGNIYIVFTDKSRINENLVAQINQKDLTGKYMAEIDHPDNKWVFKTEWVGRQEEKWEWKDETNPIEKVCVQPFVEGRKVNKLVPPRPTPPSHSVFGAIRNSMLTQPTFSGNVTIYKTEQEKTTSNKLDMSDPIYILINKSRKIDTEVTMNITISLPPQSLYNIAKESFENGDEKFIKYILEELSVDKIKYSLKTAITNMYEQNKEF